MNDTVSPSSLPSVSREEIQAHLSSALTQLPEPPQQTLSPVPTGPSPRRRGRPREVAAEHLWLGLLWAVLEGLGGYHALARLLATQALGRFAPVSVTANAVLLRLQQALFGPAAEPVCHPGRLGVDLPARPDL